MKTVTYTVSVTPVVLDSTWKKNGTNYVRLRLGLKGSTKLIKTSIVVHKEHYKGGKITYKPLKTTLDELVLETEKRLTELKSDTLAGMTLDDVERYLATYGKEDEFKLDFYTFADEVIAQKSGQSQKTYQSALNSFKAYINEDTFDISRLTSSLMRDWERWLRSKYGDGARAVSAYTNCIAFIHGQARLKYNDEELGNIRIRNPFQFYKPPRQKASKHRAVEAEFVQKMITIRSQLKGREKLGVDVFLISFALMGMNCPDLYSCKLDKDDVLHYFRTKTRGRRDDGAEMFVRIEPAIKEIIGEYLSDDKDMAFKFSSMYTSYQIFGENVNAGLDKFCERINAPKVTLYWARHSWATIAYANGVTKGVINDCLCHVDRDMKVTDIYVKKNWAILWDANKKVLDLFKWAA